MGIDVYLYSMHNPAQEKWLPSLHAAKKRLQEAKTPREKNRIRGELRKIQNKLDAGYIWNTYNCPFFGSMGLDWFNNEGKELERQWEEMRNSLKDPKTRKLIDEQFGCEKEDFNELKRRCVKDRKKLMMMLQAAIDNDEMLVVDM